MMLIWKTGLKNNSMVSKKALKIYGFKTMEEFFDYIIDSKINGQSTQCVTLIKEMSLKQMKYFLKYLFISPSVSLDKEDIEFLQEKVFESF
jgi:hypothetical protein